MKTRTATIYHPTKRSTTNKKDDKAKNDYSHDERQSQDDKAEKDEKGPTARLLATTNKSKDNKNNADEIRMATMRRTNNTQIR